MAMVKNGTSNTSKLVARAQVRSRALVVKSRVLRKRHAVFAGEMESHPPWLQPEHNPCRSHHRTFWLVSLLSADRLVSEVL
jgi:hypothetical protein